MNHIQKNNIRISFLTFTERSSGPIGSAQTLRLNGRAWTVHNEESSWIKPT